MACNAAYNHIEQSNEQTEMDIELLEVSDENACETQEEINEIDDSLNTLSETSNENTASKQIDFELLLNPTVRLERLSKKQIYKLTKHHDHQTNIKSFIKQNRYERRVSNKFQNSSRRRSNIEDSRNKWNALQEFLECQYGPCEFTKYQHEIEFYKFIRRRQFADIDRYSADTSETSSVSGNSSVRSESFRPRRSLSTPVRFNFENFKSDRRRTTEIQKSVNLNASYSVEKICGMNIFNNEIIFLVKWENYSEKENTWEPLKHLRDCEELVLEYVHDELRKNSLEEDHEKVMRELLEEQKDVIEMYLAKQKSEIIDEARLKYDEFEFQCGQLLYMIIKDHLTYYNTFKKKFRHQIVLKYFLELEKEQNKAHDIIIKEIMEKEMDMFPVYIENNVDFSIFESFKYTRENIFPEGFQSHHDLSKDNKTGCKCKVCDRMSKCCPKIMNGNFAYRTFNDGNRLTLFNSQMIFECNDYCNCNADCINRLTQQPRKHPLAIFKTKNGRGWGLKAVKAIPRGAYIIEYTGEIINQEESIRRGEKYDEQGRSYLFDLDFNEKSEAVYTIDAAHYGNLSRLINHSCEPNCRIWPVTTCNDDSSIYKLCYFSTRSIKPGEELTIDYSGGTVMTDSDKDDDENDEMIDVTPLNNIAHKHRTLDFCKCGSSFCKGYIFI